MANNTPHVQFPQQQQQQQRQQHQKADTLFLPTSGEERLVLSPSRDRQTDRARVKEKEEVSDAAETRAGCGERLDRNIDLRRAALRQSVFDVGLERGVRRYHLRHSSLQGVCVSFSSLSISSRVDQCVVGKPLDILNSTFQETVPRWTRTPRASQTDSPARSRV